MLTIHLNIHIYIIDFKIKIRLLVFIKKGFLSFKMLLNLLWRHGYNLLNVIRWQKVWTNRI